MKKLIYTYKSLADIERLSGLESFGEALSRVSSAKITQAVYMAGRLEDNPNLTEEESSAELDEAMKSVGYQGILASINRALDESGIKIGASCDSDTSGSKKK